VVINRKCRGTCGMLTVDMIVAMGIMLLVLIPLSFSYLNEQKLLRAHYWHAISMEIVDGEMEVLAAGEWRSFPEGSQPYKVESPAARNLPPGKFTFSRRGDELRLEWQPEKKGNGGTVVREAKGT
jgi:hypothetical protein